MPKTISVPVECQFDASKTKGKTVVCRTIDVAETASFALLGMVQTTSPIHRNVAFLSVQSSGAFHTAAGTDATELKEPVENRAVITDVVFALFAHVTVHIIRSDFL